MAAPGLSIGRARLHGAGPDTRDMLMRAVDTVTPGALGLSPRATLIVRRVAMRTRLPRTGSTDGFGAVLRDELRARAVAARRSGRAGGNADVLFEDDAALEAAIVVDWLDWPQAAATAWWTPVVGPLSPPEHWRRAVFRAMPLLPRVLARLVTSGHANAWLARFGDDELAVAAARITAMHTSVSSSVAPGPADASPKPKDAAAVTIPAISQAPAILVSIAPEALAPSSPAARRLLAVALVAVRRPALLGTAVFAEALAKLNLSEPAHGDLRAMPSTPAASQLTVATPDASTGGNAPQDTQTASRPRRTSLVPHLVPDVPLPEVRPANTPTLADPPANADPTPSASPAATPLAPRPIVETGFGGLFFLLNAFVALGLYGTLADPRGSLRGLSPFELLNLLGRRWFGHEFVRDPLHPMLCALAGLGNGERPGGQFEAPAWTVPGDWLTPWPDGRATRSGRRHSAGFPLTGDARRWLSCFARYLEARLVRAIGEDDACDTLCRRCARIACDDEEVEIGMTLDMHPLAIRLAGLDRDPGWMPAAGRRIGFVFS